MRTLAGFTSARWAGGVPNCRTTSARAFAGSEVASLFNGLAAGLELSRAGQAASKAGERKMQGALNLLGTSRD
jgi:hypothetical protein